MLSRTTISCCIGIVLLGGTLVLRQCLKGHRTYLAESLLMVRPFENALLGHGFEREVRSSSPGNVRLTFLAALFTETTLKGRSVLTNGVIRLVAEGATRVDAELAANSAAGQVRALLERQYSIQSALIGPAQSVSSAALSKPFWPRLGHATPSYFPTAGRVLFPKAAISIDPGDAWLRSYTVWREPECELTLRGKGKFTGGFISALQFGQNVTNVQTGIRVRRDEVENQHGFNDSSWLEEPFVTESGLHGMHMSYTRQYPAPFQRGMVLMTQTSHEYLITNTQSRCVGIAYITASSRSEYPQSTVPVDAVNTVQEIIRRTLKTE
jgi:hypothetical protein